MGLLDVHGVESSGYEKTLILVPLKSVPLEGRVLPFNDGVGLENAELHVSYEAIWLCNFFNEMDCGVPSWRVATEHLGANGTFRVMVPDFAGDPAVKQWTPGPLTNFTSRFYLSVNRRTAPYDYQLGNVSIAPAYPELVLSPKR